MPVPGDDPVDGTRQTAEAGCGEKSAEERPRGTAGAQGRGDRVAADVNDACIVNDVEGRQAGSAVKAEDGWIDVLDRDRAKLRA